MSIKTVTGSILFTGSKEKENGYNLPEPTAERGCNHEKGRVNLKQRNDIEHIRKGAEKSKQLHNPYHEIDNAVELVLADIGMIKLIKTKDSDVHSFSATKAQQLKHKEKRRERP